MRARRSFISACTILILGFVNECIDLGKQKQVEDYISVYSVIQSIIFGFAWWPGRPSGVVVLIE